MRWKRRREARAEVDLVRGELSALRAALDAIPVGILVLDAELRAQFISRAFRKMLRLPDAKADSKPAFVALMYRSTRRCDHLLRFVRFRGLREFAFRPGRTFLGSTPPRR